MCPVCVADLQSLNDRFAESSLKSASRFLSDENLTVLLHFVQLSITYLRS